MSIHKNSTAGELLFDGYEDTLLSMADMMAKEGDRPMDKFAWFYKVSETSSQSTSGSQSSRQNKFEMWIASRQLQSSNFIEGGDWVKLVGGWIVDFLRFSHQKGKGKHNSSKSGMILGWQTCVVNNFASKIKMLSLM